MIRLLQSFSCQLEHFTHSFAKWAGSAYGFLAAILSLALWLIAGKIAGFSSNWANAMSIYIEVIAFLMIFLMQRSQNKELAALHIKLNEIIFSDKNADNRFINVEKLTEEELSNAMEAHQETNV